MFKLISISIIALLLSVFSFDASLSNVYKYNYPLLAKKSILPNGFAFMHQAEAEFKQAVVKAGNDIAIPLSTALKSDAQAGFAIEPTAYKAVRILAFGEVADGSEPRARQIMRLLNTTVKRDPVLNMWLARDFGREGEIEKLLQQYDYTLRSNAAASDSLLTVMTGALENDAFVDPMDKLLAKRPPWSDSFWRSSVTSQNSLSNVARLRIKQHRRHIDIPHELDQRILSKLVQAGQLGTAKRLSVQLSDYGKPDKKNLLINPSFEKPTVFLPFGWNFISKGQYGAGMDLKNKVLRISALPGSGGIVAEQLAELASGRYLARIKFQDNYDPGTSIKLSYQCASRARNKPIQYTDRLSAESPTAVLSIATNPDCGYFWIGINIFVDPLGKASDVAIESILLEPL